MAPRPPPSDSGSTAPECVDPDLALDFVEGRCSPAQVKAIERHVDGCELCRQFLSELARDSDAGPPGPGAPKAASASLSGPASPEERLVQQRLERGRTVGRYLLLDQVGSGAMAVVYSAYDPELDRKVAVKLLRVRQAERKVSQARLLREAQAMARLQHPNVLAVYDAGTLGDEVFIAMELVRGSTVTAWLARRRRSWREILQVFISAGRGLAAAHAADLVHRDFKPDNMLISRDGRVRVTDFGLARDLGAEHSVSLTPGEFTTWLEQPQLTRTGVLVGSPAYMSPEQFQSRNVDARSDQFSFCVALYEALYGERPFKGDTFEDVRQSVMEHRLAPAPSRGNGPLWLRKVLLRGLEAEPDARFESMEALLEELEQAPRTVRWRQLALAVGLVLGAAGALGYHTHQQRRESCLGAERQLAGIWDTARKQAMSQVFLATKMPYASDAWSSVERLLDGYTGRWKREWTQACEATRIHAQQPEEVMVRRHQCLELRREKLRTLTEVLSQASTSEVREAATIIGSLPGLEACTLAVVQPAAPAPAPSEATPEQAQLSAVLTRIDALRAAGKYKEGLAQADTVLARARQLGDRELEAEGLYRKGYLHSQLFETEAAQRTLQQAFFLTEALGRDELKARVQIELVWLTGTLLKQHEQAEAWASHAQATIERLGGAPDIQVRLHNHMGSALAQQGRYKEASERLLRARELATAQLGEDHPQLSGIWSNYGTAMMNQGRYPEALEATHRGLDIALKWLGPHHPKVARLRLNAALASTNAKRTDEALVQVRQALATFEQAFGPESIQAAEAGRFLSHIYLLRKEYARAQEAVERPLAITRRHHGEGSAELASPLHLLAQARLGQGHAAEALALTQQALELEIRALGPRNPLLGEYLLTIGQAQHALGRHEQAVASLERALQLDGLEQAEPAIIADTRFALAQALWTMPQQRERARALARQVLDFYGSQPLEAQKKADVEAWLAGLNPRGGTRW